jgi:hypothetical protein
MRNRNSYGLILWLIFLINGFCSVGQAPRGSIDIFVVDQQTGAQIADPVVTVAGRVIPPCSGGAYKVSPQASEILVRAPGYRADRFTASAAVMAHGRLALRPFTVRALYLTEYGIASRALREPVLRMIHEGKANALVVNIKSDWGLLPYPSSIALASSIGARKITTIPSLSDLVRKQHEQGIYMIARIVTFKDNPLASAHPEWAVRLQDGTIFKDREHLAWTDPFRPEVRAYNIAIAVEAALAGFDEVQFDYVRFPDSAAKLKLSGPVDEASRVRAIVAFLDEARQALIPYNVFESVDIFGYVAWNKNDTGIGQHLEEITAAVDYVCPMLYPSGFKFGIPGHRNPLATDQDIYDTVKISLDQAIRRTSVSPKKFRPWLQAFRDYAFNRRQFGAVEIAKQIEAVRDAGADGWALWNPRNQYGTTGLGQ